MSKDDMFHVRELSLFNKLLAALAKVKKSNAEVSKSMPVTEELKISNMFKCTKSQAF